jgi:hypothetical protein
MFPAIKFGRLLTQGFGSLQIFCCMANRQIERPRISWFARRRASG